MEDLLAYMMSTYSHWHNSRVYRVTMYNQGSLITLGKFRSRHEADLEYQLAINQFQEYEYE